MNHDLQRFERKYIPEPNSGCWLWFGDTNPDGYGRFKIDGKFRPAHRVSLELVGVALHSGLQVDHLCRVRCCVNPEHLEPVTPRENTLRAIRCRTVPDKTLCAYGHELARVGSFLREGRKTPACMECARISRRNYRKVTRSGGAALQPPMSSFAHLPFQIECKSTGAFFEPTAAFNHIKVAYRYAQDCLRTNPHFEYRLHDLVRGKTYKINAYRGWGAQT